MLSLLQNSKSDKSIQIIMPSGFNLIHVVSNDF